MKTHNASSPPRLLALLFGAALLGLVSQGALAVQQGTASGTAINNLAKLSYSAGGVAQNEICSAPGGNSTGNGGTSGTTCSSGTNGASNTTFVVDKKVNVTVATTDVAAVAVVPGQTAVVTTFTVTNMGNDTQDFALSAANVASGQVLFTKTDNFQTTGPTAYVESGGTGGYQAGQDTATYIDELASGASITVYVVATIPASQVNGDAALVSLTATARAGGGAAVLGGALTETAGADTPGVVDTVFADSAGSDDASRDAAHSARSAYVVTSSVISVAKTVAVLCDPFNGVTNQKNIPGAIVQYSIAITNSGASSATLTTVTDALDSHVAHDPGLRAPTNAATCIAGAGTSGFQITSSAGGRALGGTAGVMTNAADADGATIAGSNITIDFSAALPAGGGYTAGELKTGETATVKYNAIIQ